MAAAKHPGASELEILNEPDWTQTHSHRVGSRSRDARFMGMTHGGDEHPPEDEETEKIWELREKAERGELITVRDVMTSQKDFHLERPTVHPSYWRYVLYTTESYIKYEQSWEINHKKKGGQEPKRESNQQQTKQNGGSNDQGSTSQKPDGVNGKEKESQNGPDGYIDSSPRPKRSHKEEALFECL